MSKAAFFILPLALVGGFALAQTSLKKAADRPVFRSARVLAGQCQSFSDFESRETSRLPSDAVQISAPDMARISGCVGYIQGYEDAMLEGLGPHYHPVPAEESDMVPFVGTFLKLVADHPEEEDFAATTVLHEAEKVMADAEKPHQ